MPPLFVDSVEIADVYVDSVKQDKVFSDSVEVYSGFTEQYFYDDFERSANGTLVTDHIMNTGHAWSFLDEFSEPAVIATVRGEQGANYSQSENTQIELVPIPNGQTLEQLFLPPYEAWTIRMKGAWERADASQSGVFIYIYHDVTDYLLGYFYATFNQEFIVTPVCQLVVGDGSGELYEQGSIPPGNMTADLTLYLDLTTKQYSASVIDGNGSFRSTPRQSYNFVVKTFWASTQESAGVFNNPVSPSVLDFEMTPYKSADLPWPQ